MMNPAKLFKIKGAWDKFTQDHPKFPMFINAVRSTGIEEGTVIEINVTTPDGKNLSTNIKVTQSDKELLAELMELSKG
ncbi:MAG TPA: hypothetical protein VN258_19995 [Mobilitalea sp.]|nr:hypothetical protein [Mobilitalea sp.]